ncbi:alpha/beta hydrolase [Lysobacter sp. CA196]|uniref:alpha/beta hydrolase n=1 Tax=Lysobacter sp. CA196 TaxID=3455606 RepID=UPI003F8D5459
MGLCLIVAPAASQPRDPMQTVGATVADTESPHYRFERFIVASEDGQRRWRIALGIPKRPAPRGGFSSLYMLDGNAALMAFDADLLAQLSQAAPPVLVFIGYDNELRIDGPARTRDYTPTATADEAGGPARGGGAQVFADVIHHRIQPEVRRRVRLNPTASALWGHSFGGLFVLDMLYTHTDAFRIWLPASPSLWWDRGVMLGSPEKHFLQRANAPAADVLLMQGTRERERSGRKDPKAAAHLARVGAVPEDAAQRLSERLHAKDGVRACFRAFDGLGHGAMLPASLRAAALTMANHAADVCAAAAASRGAPIDGAAIAHPRRRQAPRAWHTSF